MEQISDPQLMMLAEKMAQHYISTLYRIKLKKKKYSKQWLAIKPTDRQDIIESFAVILSAADTEEQKTLEPKVIRPLQR